MHRARVRCLCGDVYEVSNASLSVVEDAVGDWEIMHSGEGHGPATSQQAYRARQRRKREHEEHRELLRVRMGDRWP